MENHEKKKKFFLKNWKVYFNFMLTLTHTLHGMAGSFFPRFFLMNLTKIQKNEDSSQDKFHLLSQYVFSTAHLLEISSVK